MNAPGLIPIITKPTRITNSSYTLIDNSLFSNLLNFSSGILTADISDHFPIFFVYKNYFINLNKNPHEVTYRIINETILNELCNGLREENLHENVDESSIDLSIEFLHERVLQNSKLQYPLKAKTISPKDLDILGLILILSTI